MTQDREEFEAKVILYPSYLQGKNQQGKVKQML